VFSKNIFICSWFVFAGIILFNQELVAAEKKEKILYDFCTNINQAKCENTADTSVTWKRCSGKMKESIFQHPPIDVGKGPAKLTYSGIELPLPEKGEKLFLKLNIGMADARWGKTEADGVCFIIKINDKEVFSKKYRKQKWCEQKIDLKDFAGQKVDITFMTDALKNSDYDWALWGKPRIVSEGKK